MSRRLVLFAALALFASAPALAAAPGAPVSARPAASAASAASPAKLKNVTLHIFNRVFASFHDKVVAVPNKELRVGDTEFTFRIIRFEPDFTMDIKHHKVTSRSGEPKNPAFQIVVSRNGAPHDTSWAFFNMPPHFGVKEELAFVATRIEFLNRPTLASKDSIAVRLESHGGAAH
jgi:hypothetical protein